MARTKPKPATKAPAAAPAEVLPQYLQEPDSQIRRVAHWSVLDSRRRGPAEARLFMQKVGEALEPAILRLMQSAELKDVRSGIRLYLQLQRSHGEAMQREQELAVAAMHTAAAEEQAAANREVMAALEGTEAGISAEKLQTLVRNVVEEAARRRVETKGVG